MQRDVLGRDQNVYVYKEERLDEDAMKAWYYSEYQNEFGNLFEQFNEGDKVSKLVDKDGKKVPGLKNANKRKYKQKMAAKASVARTLKRKKWRGSVKSGGSNQYSSSARRTGE